MKSILPALLLAAALPAAALAQSYPSPTFRNLTPALSYGVTGSGEQTTTTTTASSPSVTLAAADDFAAGNGVAIEHAGTAFSGTAPSSITVTTTGATGQGPTGSTTYAYKLACVDAAGGVGAATSATTVTTGNATLGLVTQASDEIAFNDVKWTQGAGCVGTAVWRSASGGAYVLLGVFDATGLNGLGGSEVQDTGFPTVTMPWIPATAPSAALPDRLVTSISTISGTAVVMANNAISAGTSLIFRHDDTAAMNAYTAASTSIFLPAGTYNVEALTIPTTVQSVAGVGPALTFIESYAASGSAVLATGMPSGFTVAAMNISAYASGNVIALELDSSTGASVENMWLGGQEGIKADSDSFLTFRGNTIPVWYHAAVAESNGTHNTFSDNVARAGQAPTQAVGFYSSIAAYAVYSNNRLEGGEIFGFDGDKSVSSLWNGNFVYGSEREAYHLQETGANNSFIGNYADAGTVGLDFCLSVSDDSNSGGEIITTTISGNTLIDCGAAGIGVGNAGVGGTSTQVFTTITGNTIIADNKDGTFDEDIEVVGATAEGTYISGNTFLPSAAHTFNVKEISVSGFPSQTVVGPEHGILGTTSVASLSGTGSYYEPVVSYGNHSALSGTCVTKTPGGGTTAGAFAFNGACSSGTVVLTFAVAQPNGYACTMTDAGRAVSYPQIGWTTGTATFGVSGALTGGVVSYSCQGF